MKAEVNLAVPTSVGLPKPATNEEVRSKFLNMIGIESKLPQTTPVAGASNSSEGGSLSPTQQCLVDTSWQHPRIQKVTCFTEALKYDRAADERYSQKRRKTEAAKSVDKSTKKKLIFNETVEVVPIPLRTEYSNRVRTRIWATAAEIYMNAHRNTVEFAFEGWDWRTVTEDERMYVCVATGELIHPCHCEGHFHSEP